MSDAMKQVAELYAAATEGPWAWLAAGEKDNAWGLGTWVKPGDELIAGMVNEWEAEQFDDKSLVGAEAVCIDHICEGSGRLADPALIVALHNAWPELRAELQVRRQLMGAYYVPLSAETDDRSCTCRLVHAQSHLEPAEWEQDPECDQHGDIRYLKTQRESAEREVKRLHYELRIANERGDNWRDRFNEDSSELVRLRDQLVEAVELLDDAINRAPEFWLKRARAFLAARSSTPPTAEKED